MNNEHIKGAVDKGAGRVKEAAGRATDDKRLENEGKFDQVKGAVHSAVGDVKDTIKEVSRRP